MFNDNLKFDYSKEPARDIICADCKSFYASTECVERGLDPLTTKLVVMSYPANDDGTRGSGLVLAASPAAKKAYGITNVSRARDLPFPYPKDLHIVAPRMTLYMKKNAEINNIYRRYVDEKNHSVYSVDESFLDVTDSLKLFDCSTTDQLARLIQIDVYRSTGIYVTIGIGDNPVQAKIALDIYSKHNSTMRGEIRYETVQEKIWSIENLTDVWGIGKKTAAKLEKMNIHNMRDLAHADYYRLKNKFGIIGTQLFATAWGIDRSFLGQKYEPKSKSIGNSQVLNKDYTRKEELQIVVREMADQVATRLRRINAKTECVSLWCGYSINFFDKKGKTNFHQQIRVPQTNSSKEIARYLLLLLDKHYERQDIRSVGVNCSRLTYTSAFQMNLFEEPEKQLDNRKIEFVIDNIRRKYTFAAIVYASSLLEGGRAIERSSLVGGHAGGMSGIESEQHG
ncbi:DNA polymerase V [Enterococcus sp. AZ163]